jgi:hypothetical protein
MVRRIGRKFSGSSQTHALRDKEKSAAVGMCKEAQGPADHFALFRLHVLQEGETECQSSSVQGRAKGAV